MTKIYIAVPVSERLPEEEKMYPVIFFGGTEHESITSVSYDKQFTFYSESEDCTGITHWLEERELPREEEIEEYVNEINNEFLAKESQKLDLDIFMAGANFIINKITGK